MMIYVIKRSDGMYAARPGSARSYTKDKAQAAEYQTQEEAERNACGNESIWFEPAASCSQRVG